MEKRAMKNESMVRTIAVVLVEIGLKMSTHMVPHLQLTAAVAADGSGDSRGTGTIVQVHDASTMWVEWYDLTWRRQMQQVDQLTLPRLCCLLSDLRTTCDKFSILSREDCLEHVMPEQARAPVPCVGTRVVLDVAKYIQYMEQDAKHILDDRKRMKKHRRHLGWNDMEGDGGYGETPVEIMPLMEFRADLDDSCSRAHEVVVGGSILDCVVSNVVSRGGGGSPYCLVSF